MIFLSGMPRSGTTLLTSLLNQRTDVYATPTSNLSGTVGATIKTWQEAKETQASKGTFEDLLRIIDGILKNRYDIDKLVFDKNTNWAHPYVVRTLSCVQDVKIVATVRPMSECVASFVKIAKPDNVSIEMFLKSAPIKFLLESYSNLIQCYTEYPDKLLLIEYNNLITQPQQELDRISNFVGLEKFKHDFNNVPESKEVDIVWKIKDLHKVRKKVSKSKYSVKEVLGDKIYNCYLGGEFWNDKPEPEKVASPIIIQHDALMSGNYKLSKKLAYENLKNYPDDPDIAFNAGWAKLSDGDVENGYKLLDKGRVTTVWGDSLPSGKPVWSGEKGTVLLKLERGLGDQLHQVRYARELKKAGCTVIVSCSPELSPIINTMPEVDVIFQLKNTDEGVYHDYTLPAMSAPIQLGYKTNDNIDGTPYIPRPDVDVVKGRVGVRWQGFNGYEHQTKRLFPADLMFNAVKDQDCISLQRDEGSELRPRWIQSVPLDTWEDTAKAVASCELVVTSCTSIAHLAGAMGVPTWIVVPIVPYYLWTYPGAVTPYYNSMTLYRQTTVNSWEEPFKAMNFNKGLAHAA